MNRFFGGKEEELDQWTPPENFTVINTVDAHTAGEPLRIITGGVPRIPGKSMMEKRRNIREKWDHVRKAVMLEPRGHADMYGCLLTEPVTSDGMLGVLFMHNEGYSTMCGHGIIALTTVILETGMIPLKGEIPEILIDTPAGRITARAEMESGSVTRVSFRNVPSFVAVKNLEVCVSPYGRVRCDVAFGGAFYALCQAEDLNLDLIPENSGELIRAGKKIRDAAEAAFPPRHPVENDLDFLYGTIFVGPPEDSRHHSRNVCIFAEGEVDRSPTGTGLSARAALHFQKGEISSGEIFVVESLLGTLMECRVVDTLKLGSYEAVVPEVSGRAHITGRHQFFMDPKDPLKEGFLIR